MAEALEPNSHGAPWLPRSLPSLHDITETARRAGHYAWLEARLASLFGELLTTVSEPDVKVWLGTRSDGPARRAALWRERIPAIGGVDPTSMIVPTNEAFVRFADELAATRPGDTVEAMVGIARVLLPRLVGAYAAQRNATNAVTDAPSAVTLTTVWRDAADEWLEAEMIVQRLIIGPADVERAGRRQQTLEALLVDAGGLVGPPGI